ncbi:MAG: sigma-54-dependent Fis family transcriptional regulator [Bryobacterales bacterium]|nr:sigma-54-dependent Fis family transcriptional regulator [Bryobacterales bacterium]
MRACSALFLFRSLAAATASSEDERQAARIEEQILRLFGDLAGGEDISGFILLAKGEHALATLAKERRADVKLVERACRDGAVEGAAPLFVHGAIEGMIIVDLPSQILAALATLASAALESVRDIETLQVRNALLEERVESGILGSSPAIQRLVQMIDRLAPLDTTVLVLGESGTGKELVARALHDKSARRQAPFVAINCAALTPALLESELFGHEKGAFTDAATQKKGKLEIADGGTVFLDEVGELAPELQAKLLRVLQQREFERVGGTKTLRLDVRLIAATNRDLSAEVRRGAFREDLFHRLNVVALRTPPLRDRREDIALLGRHFVARAAARCGRRVDGISPEAEHCLAAYAWPGNVRELENAIERAVVLGESNRILPEDLPESVLEAAPAPDLSSAYQTSVGGAKREAILRAWNESEGDYKAAAKRLGLHPNSLLRLVRNLGLREVLKS